MCCRLRWTNARACVCCFVTANCCPINSLVNGDAIERPICSKSIKKTYWMGLEAPSIRTIGQCVPTPTPMSTTRIHAIHGELIQQYTAFRLDERRRCIVHAMMYLRSPAIKIKKGVPNQFRWIFISFLHADETRMAPMNRRMWYDGFDFLLISRQILPLSAITWAWTISTYIATYYFPSKCHHRRQQWQPKWTY